MRLFQGRRSRAVQAQQQDLLSQCVNPPHTLLTCPQCRNAAFIISDPQTCPEMVCWDVSLSGRTSAMNLTVKKVSSIAEYGTIICITGSVTRGAPSPGLSIRPSCRQAYSPYRKLHSACSEARPPHALGSISVPSSWTGGCFPYKQPHHHHPSQHC